MHNTHRQLKGFTLLELLIVLTITSIVASMAVSSYADYSEKKRLISAAQTLSSQMQFARLEAVKRAVELRVSFAANNTTSWQYGITDEVAGTDATFGCTPSVTVVGDAGACTIEYDNDLSTDYGADGLNDGVLYRFDNADFTNVTMKGLNTDDVQFDTGNAYTTFDAVRGTAGSFANPESGTVVFTTPNYTIHLKISVLGHPVICYPAGSSQIGGYGECA